MAKDFKLMWRKKKIGRLTSENVGWEVLSYNENDDLGFSKLNRVPTEVLEKHRSTILIQKKS